MFQMHRVLTFQKMVPYLQQQRRRHTCVLIFNMLLPLHSFSSSNFVNQVMQPNPDVLSPINPQKSFHGLVWKTWPEISFLEFYVMLRINSEAVAMAPPVIECWMILSRVKVPSLNERRAPVNAPPIAAFFCFIKKVKNISNVSILHAGSFKLTFIRENLPYQHQWSLPKDLQVLCFVEQLGLKDP